MSDIALVYLILAAAVVLFVSGRVPVGIVAIGVALALWATGILSLTAALAGFGDPTVLFIASLFVVSEGLGATGVTAWAGQRLIAVVGTDQKRLLVLTGTPVNVLVSEAALDVTGHGFGYFEFTVLGVPLVLGAMLIAVLFGDRL